MTKNQTSDYIAWEDTYKVEQALFNAKQYRIYLYLCIGKCVALRATEMLNLTWADFGMKELRVEEQKTHKVRVIPLKDETKAAVKKVVNILHPEPTEKIFKSHSKKGTMSSQYISKKLHYYAAPIVGWDKNISTHTVRKTFGRRVYDQSTDKGHALVMLNEIFKHSSMRVTKIYLGITEDEINDIYKAL